MAEGHPPGGRESEDIAPAEAGAQDTDSRTSPPSSLLVFTPVPRQRMRRGGWSAERQRQFIELLAETGSVRAACRRLGVGEHHIYKLRNHPEAASFRKAWEAALDLGIARIEDVAMDRALNGVEEPVYHRGELVGTRRAYNDRLLMFMLRNRAPERFAEGKPRAMNAVDKMELARLKAQWRKEWEKEWGARQLEQESITIASINAKIDAMREKSDKLASPEVRAAREAYDEAVARDREEDYSPWHDPRHELYNPALTSRGARIPVSDDTQADAAAGAPFPLYDTQEEADAAGMVFNGAMLPPPDEESAEEEDKADAPGAPRLRSLKDDGWD
ncbi:hypothetical protein [Erythrobacter aureus]|uniref:hypothetical protein n=1 Tax=Erythrobacter aureus TaxID=2182384 RepID=UPI003A90CA04